MEMIRVIRRGVSREAQNAQTSGAHFTHLLHSQRTPFEQRPGLEAEGLCQRVRAFRGARICPGIHLGVRNHETLAPGHHLPGEFHKRRDAFRIDLAGLAFRIVAGVHGVGEHHCVDPRQFSRLRRISRTAP